MRLPIFARPSAVPVLLFALVWLSCSWFGSWALNPNNATRLFAAISLVKDGNATIDEFAALTIDKAQFGDHVYLDKAPGMTLMALPAVALANAVSGEQTLPPGISTNDPGLYRFMTLRLRLAAMFSSALLTALAAVALWSLARAITGSSVAGMIAALGYALGSPAWGWSTTIFGHAAVAALFTLAIWAIWWGTHDRRRGDWRLAALAGALLGWSVVVEFQAVLAGSAIGLWALWRLRALPVPARLPLILAALAGGLAAGLPLIGYNLIAFGVPIKFGYSGVVGFEGMQQGFFGLTYPKPAVVVEILFGLRRGLIWVAPILVLSPIGLAIWYRHAQTRAMAITIIAAITIVLLVNAAYVYWDGGFSTGPRHSVPALPLMALGLAPLWQSLERPRARIAVLVVLVLSIMINLAIAATEITVPDGHHFPLWRPILTEDVVRGYFHDLPSDFWGWSPWAGTALYLVLAAGLTGAIIAALRAPRHPTIAA